MCMQYTYIPMGKRQSSKHIGCTRTCHLTSSCPPCSAETRLHPQLIPLLVIHTSLLIFAYIRTYPPKHTRKYSSSRVFAVYLIYIHGKIQSRNRIVLLPCCKSWLPSVRVCSQGLMDLYCSQKLDRSVTKSFTTYQKQVGGEVPFSMR